jgi:hypothetical protein
VLLAVDVGRAQLRDPTGASSARIVLGFARNGSTWSARADELD